MMQTCTLNPNYRVSSTLRQLNARAIRHNTTSLNAKRVISATISRHGHWTQAGAVKITAAVASALILSTSPLLALPPPAHADIQTVSADELINTAKPLKITQKIDKGRIWLLIILGASSLFSTTVVLENNDKWFPAISRANKAMRASSKKGRKTDESITSPESDMSMTSTTTGALDNNNNNDQEDEDSARLQAAVLEGMASARQRVATSPDNNNNNGMNSEDTSSSSKEYEDTRPDALITNWGSEMSDVEEVEMSDNNNNNSSSSSEAEEDKEEEEQQEQQQGGVGRKPLFEISSEQIEESLKRKKLEQLSVEDLQRELLARQQQSSSGEK